MGAYEIFDLRCYKLPDVIKLSVLLRMLTPGRAVSLSVPVYLSKQISFTIQILLATLVWLAFACISLVSISSVLVGLPTFDFQQKLHLSTLWGGDFRCGTKGDRLYFTD